MYFTNKPAGGLFVSGNHDKPKKSGVNEDGDDQDDNECRTK